MDNLWFSFIITNIKQSMRFFTFKIYVFKYKNKEFCFQK